MFELNGVSYPVKFANYQRNSCVNEETDAKGKLAWAVSYNDIKGLENMFFINKTVLINGEYIGVKTNMHLLVYKSNGLFQYMVPISANSPVIFGKDAVAYVRTSYLLSYQDYSGNPILETANIPSLEEWAHALFLKPEDKDFFGAIQFTGGPAPLNMPATFDVYKQPIGKFDETWSYHGEGAIDYAFFTRDFKKIIIIYGNHVSFLNAGNGSVISGFDMDYQSVEAVSVDFSDGINVLGRGKKGKGNRPVLTIFDHAGKEKLEYELQKPQSWQPPACGTDGRVYVVDNQALLCLKDGKLLWKKELSGREKAFMTITKNNSVLLVQAGRFQLIGANGTGKYELQQSAENENFEAPPSVDNKGKIYVAGDKKLYCIE